MGADIFSRSGWLGLFVLVALLFAGRADAVTETIAATPVPATASVYYQNGIYQRSTAYDACHAYLGSANMPHSVEQKTSEPPHYWCNNTQNGNVTHAATTYAVWSCTTGPLVMNGWTGTCPSMAGTYTCPPNQGWQLNGSQCVRDACAAGELRYNGVCKVSCPYPGKGGPHTGQTYNGSGTAPATLCIDGCTYKRAWTVQAGPGAWGIEAGLSTGASCSTGTVGTDSSGNPIAPASTNGTPAVSAGEAASKCIGKGQGWGTVNGVVVCDGGGAGTTTERVESKTTESTPSVGGPTEKKSTETKTTCIAGVCTSETTTTTDPGTGGATTTSTSKETSSAAAFCEKNPTDAKCVAAKKDEQSKWCSEHPDSVSCKDMGTPEDGNEQVGTKAAGLSVVTPVTMGVDMTCPADIALPHGAAFSWTPICDVAGMLRPVVLVVAWLAAGLLVVGGLKGAG